jgi:hypothetical protein
MGLSIARKVQWWTQCCNCDGDYKDVSSNDSSNKFWDKPPDLVVVEVRPKVRKKFT